MHAIKRRHVQSADLVCWKIAVAATVQCVAVCCCHEPAYQQGINAPPFNLRSVILEGTIGTFYLMLTLTQISVAELGHLWEVQSSQTTQENPSICCGA